jgi:hypothetical protein
LAAAISLALAMLAGSAWAAVPVTVNATVGQGGPPVSQAIKWAITKLDRNGVPEAKPIFTLVAPVLQTDLSPGQYLILGRGPEMAAQMAVTVGENPVSRTLVMGMAQMSIRLITARGRKPVKDPVNWELRTYEKGKPGGGEFVSSQSGATAHFNVPAGGYVVGRVTNWADLVVPLQPGQAYDYTVNLYAGHGRLSGWQGEKRVVQDIKWQVVREKPNGNGQYILVAETQGDNPTLMLREGNYLVIGSSKELWGMGPMSIVSGQTVKGHVQMKTDVGKPEVVAAP